MIKDSKEIHHDSGQNPVASLNIVPDERYLEAIVDLVSDLAEANGISKKDTWQLDKILIEIFRNIVKYAKNHDSRKESRTQ